MNEIIRDLSERRRELENLAARELTSSKKSQQQSNDHMKAHAAASRKAEEYTKAIELLEGPKEES